MKFIYRDERFHRYLTAWSGSVPLVTASFSAWNAGSPLQKSLEGLLRSLLYDLLAQLPALSPACSISMTALAPSPCLGRRRRCWISLITLLTKTTFHSTFACSSMAWTNLAVILMKRLSFSTKFQLLHTSRSVYQVVPGQYSKMHSMGVQISSFIT